MAKKEKELKPEIQEIEYNTKPIVQSDMEIVKVNGGAENSDSFFRNVVNKLFDNSEISLKTEYLNVTENFSGSKLEFLSAYGNMPYLKEFITIFEKKRVSLERKGRKEILMALQQRQEEIKQEQINKARSILGLE